MKSLKCNLGYHNYEERKLLARHLYDRNKARFIKRCQHCDNELLFDESISENIVKPKLKKFKVNGFAAFVF